MQPPKEPVGKLRPAPPPRVEVFPPGNFHFPAAPTRAVGASRASKAHIVAQPQILAEFELFGKARTTPNLLGPFQSMPNSFGRGSEEICSAVSLK